MEREHEVAQELRTMTAGMQGKRLDGFARTCTLEDLETVGEPWRTLLVQRIVGLEDKFDGLDRTFLLAPGTGKGKNVAVKGRNKNGLPDRVTLTKATAFSCRDAIYLYNKYGPHALQENLKGLVKEVKKESEGSS